MNLVLVTAWVLAVVTGGGHDRTAPIVSEGYPKIYKTQEECWEAGRELDRLVQKLPTNKYIIYSCKERTFYIVK